MNIFYKLAANDGMNLRVLVAYRWIFSTAFIAPFALFFDRRKRPKLTWMILVQAFLSGLFGGMLAQNLYVESLVREIGIKDNSREGQDIRIVNRNSGAMLLTFYKGVEIKIWSTNVHLLKHSHQIRKSHFTAKHIVGSSLALGSCISYAMWLILQTKISKGYPCHYSSTALMSLMGSIQCVTLSLCLDRNWNQWKLGWNVRLLTVAYAGIVTSGLVVTLIAWCVRIRGPVFVASFNPLSLVLVAIAGSLLLEEKLHLGREQHIRGRTDSVDIYLVLWGQSKEMKVKPELVPTTKVPQQLNWLRLLLKVISQH
ncbi:hypothetical protein GH714_004366 [Hevea brasiliensis]|uniref:WAT1-related protein n=1 Tax=Hevea brasiliensis TaxID=3981 RepID=A0A6A6KXH6_HEVBR|nr:hypothetical protein GH714_004366 [Hevea brasiliensis]